MSESLTVVIPAYNEEACLKAFLPEAVRYCENRNFQLIVVNDGSIDKSGELLNNLAAHNNIVTLHHKVNKGTGGATKTGIMNSNTEFTITIDADGQHCLEDIYKLYKAIVDKDADMIVGSRKGCKDGSIYKALGKSIIRLFAKILMPMLIIHDINSGMRIFRTDLAKQYLHLCPDSFAFCDIITLAFINQKHLVLEEPITVKPRIDGSSNTCTKTAFETIMEILNMLVLFNPMRFFLPMSLLFVTAGVAWGVFNIFSRNEGISVGAMLAIMVGIISFFLGLVAEQLGSLRKSWNQLNWENRQKAEHKD